MNKYKEELSAIKRRLGCLEEPIFEMCPNCGHYVTMVKGMGGDGKFVPHWEYVYFSSIEFYDKQCTTCGKVWTKGSVEVITESE